MQKLDTATFKVPHRSLKKGVVILDLDEYRKLQAQSVPTYYLTGKKALALDRLVDEGLREHRAGRTTRASSLKEALRIYEQKNGQRRL